jgi:hypothetical protein
MNIQIIINDPDQERVEKLKIATQTMVSVEWAAPIANSLDSKSGDLIPGLQKFSDLVLHHCGDSNDEYQLFVSRYRDFCSSKGFSLPPIVLFSGRVTSDADVKFREDPQVCVVSWSDLESNLCAFLQALIVDPRPQWDLIHSIPPAQFLFALAILCQGYLAVQAGPDGSLEVDDSEDSVIASALNEMGLSKVLSEDRSRLDPRLSATDPASRDPLRIQAASPSFWDVFVEKKLGEAVPPVDLLNIVRNEWNMLHRSGDFEPIEALIKKLEAGKELISPATLVAKAYLELTKKLGKRNGS